MWETDICGWIHDAVSDLGALVAEAVAGGPVGLWGRQTPPGLTFPTCSGGEGLLPQSDPEPQGLIVALGSHRQDVRFDGVGSRSILSIFPCSTERILPLLGILGFLLLACALSHAPPFPSHHQQHPRRNTDLPPWWRDPRHVSDSSVSSLCPFSSHLPVAPRRLDHVSILRFCISARFVLAQ